MKKVWAQATGEKHPHKKPRGHGRTGAENCLDDGFEESGAKELSNLWSKNRKKGVQGNG